MLEAWNNFVLKIFLWTFFVVPNFRKLQNLPENNLENEDVKQTVNGPSLREARE